MSTVQSSPEASPTDSDPEKIGDAKEAGFEDEKQQELDNEREQVGSQWQSIKAPEARPNNDFLRPLQQTRSRSSNCSHTDGYSHFEQDDEEKQDKAASAQPEEGKEFVVQFDGDLDPYNPKNKPTWRKWTIVLIGSGCSLCVTCASAL